MPSAGDFVFQRAVQTRGMIPTLGYDPFIFGWRGDEITPQIKQFLDFAGTQTGPGIRSPIDLASARFNATGGDLNAMNAAGYGPQDISTVFNDVVKQYFAQPGINAGDKSPESFYYQATPERSSQAFQEAMGMYNATKQPSALKKYGLPALGMIAAAFGAPYLMEALGGVGAGAAGAGATGWATGAGEALGGGLGSAFGLTEGVGGGFGSFIQNIFTPGPGSIAQLFGGTGSDTLSSTVVPGIGKTVGELSAMGMSPDAIASLFPGAGVIDSGGGGFLSGVTDFINNIFGGGGRGAGGFGNLLSSLANIASTVQGFRSARDVQRAGQDPLGGYRQSYAAQLQALMNDPSSVTKLPGYQFGLEQGEQGLLRRSAAGGYTASGNELIALREFDQNFANKAYNQEAERLANLAGFGFTPTQTTAGAQSAEAQAAEVISRALANLGFMFRDNRFANINP